MTTVSLTTNIAAVVVRRRLRLRLRPCPRPTALANTCPHTRGHPCLCQPFPVKHRHPSMNAATTSTPCRQCAPTSWPANLSRGVWCLVFWRLPSGDCLLTLPSRCGCGTLLWMEDRRWAGVTRAKWSSGSCHMPLPLLYSVVHACITQLREMATSAIVSALGPLSCTARQVRCVSSCYIRTTTSVKI